MDWIHYKFPVQHGITAVLRKCPLLQPWFLVYGFMKDMRTKWGSCTEISYVNVGIGKIRNQSRLFWVTDINHMYAVRWLGSFIQIIAIMCVVFSLTLCIPTFLTFVFYFMINCKIIQLNNDNLLFDYLFSRHNESLFFMDSPMPLRFIKRFILISYDLSHKQSCLWLIV